MKRKQVLSKHLDSVQLETLVNLFPSIFGDDKIDKNNFKLIVEDNTQPKLLYHYTSLSTLQLILKQVEEKDGILKPYVEHRLPKNILKEIRIGPCSNKEIDGEILKRSLEMSLERAGYEVKSHNKNNENYVSIKFSEIPFRHI